MNYGEHFNFGPIAFCLTYFNLWSLAQSNNFTLIANDNVLKPWSLQYNG
jgi:hypothetical protein